MDAYQGVEELLKGFLSPDSKLFLSLKVKLVAVNFQESKMEKSRNYMENVQHNEESFNLEVQGFYTRTAEEWSS